MGPSSSSRPSISCFPGCDISSPIVSTTAPNWRDALAKFADWTIEIVKRTAAGFQLLPRRWVVERTLAWLNRNRRLGKGVRGFDRERQSLGLHRLHAAAHLETVLPIIQPKRLRFGH